MPYNRSDASLRNLRALETRGAQQEELDAEMNDPARFGRRKMEAVKKGLAGAAATALTPLNALAGGPGRDVVSKLESGTRRALKDAGEGIGAIKDAARDYQSASEDAAAVGREAQAERKREGNRTSPGMAKGGTAKGWGKARGARAAKLY